MTIRHFSVILTVLILAWGPAMAQLQSGPMLGYNEMKEVLLWVQTKGPADVWFEYWEEESPEHRFATAKIRTLRENGFVARGLADQVFPGKTYSYAVLVDGKAVPLSYPLTFTVQPIWKWRGDPPAFSFALGSCFYVNEPATDRPGEPYGGDYQIVGALHGKRPDFMIWSGDNVYLREPDWGSRTGMIHRYTHSRSIPELQPLLASVHHYAIWDDHDYGPNNSDRSWEGKQRAMDVFKLFWGNPGYVFPGEGITGSFTWGDCQFFLMDDRWWRSPNDRQQTGERVYWGEQQFEWLIDALTYSRASFKFVVNGGQIINPAKVFENMSNYETERTRLLETLAAENIPGVIFLTGDRHHTSLQKLDRKGTYPLYDLTISPLTSGAGKPVFRESVAPYVPGTQVSETRNFAILDLLGGLKDRRLQIRVFDEAGNQLWEHTISAKELRSGE